MKDKKMIGNTIYVLRNKKGLSQAQLGELVGVSNKAVSKWETDEANPEINLLPKLAAVLGVTTDMLFSEETSSYTNETSYAEKQTAENVEQGREVKVFNVKGIEINTQDKYEFVSYKKTKKGLPYVHIHFGKTLSNLNAKARGVVAIGNNAKGLIALGLFSMGLISVGLLSVGLLAFGCVALGLVAVGSVAMGGVAVGAVAMGVIAIGAISIGVFSVGAIAVGFWAHTGEKGIAIGKYITIWKK